MAEGMEADPGTPASCAAGARIRRRTFSCRSGAARSGGEYEILVPGLELSLSRAVARGTGSNQAAPNGDPCFVFGGLNAGFPPLGCRLQSALRTSDVRARAVELNDPPTGAPANLRPPQTGSCERSEEQLASRVDNP